MADLKHVAETSGKLAEPTAQEPVITDAESVQDEGSPKLEELKQKPKEETLPKLTAQEFRVYNRMAEGMNYYHNHFRQVWTMLKTACDTNTRPSSMSLGQFISRGLSLIHELETHHGIEEAYIFPILAQKMPEFKPGHNQDLLLNQHKQIHKGLDILGDYLKSVRTGERELVLSEMKTKMEQDGWGDVLWKHLDQEVMTLGASNMRKYWTPEEMRSMPM